MKTRVAITGVGAVSPLGVGAERTHERWVAGESGITDGLGKADEFVPTEHLTRKQARRNGRYTQMALVAAAEAIRQAGWEEPPYDASRVGCVMGTGIGGLTTMEEQTDVLRERGPGAVSPLTIPLMMPNAAAGCVAMAHGLHGQCYGVVSGCSSGGHAIGDAARMIERGDAEACVAGGSEAAITDLTRAAFECMGAASSAGVSRPFDARRDGLIIGEGAGVVVLEAEESAKRRGATTLGTVLGYGATADAYHLTAPEPAGESAAEAIRLALEDAGVESGDIVYVNAHGTATPLNDASETGALKTALGDHAYEVPVSSIKSAIGHLFGAAGAVETISLLYALRDRIAPPTLNYEEPDPDCDLDYVPRQARPLQEHERMIGITTSFGFGGHNAVLCLEAP